MGIISQLNSNFHMEMKLVCVSGILKLNPFFNTAAAIKKVDKRNYI